MAKDSSLKKYKLIEKTIKEKHLLDKIEKELLVVM